MIFFCLFTAELLETNEELNAQILNHGLEEGRHLLTVNRNIGDMGNSLAAEFEAMSLEQVRYIASNCTLTVTICP